MMHCDARMSSFVLWSVLHGHATITRISYFVSALRAQCLRKNILCVCSGMDGFYDRRSCQAASGNPSSWAGYTGQDFLPQHAVPGIDYAAIHLWPDNWKRTDNDFGTIWLTNHSANGAQLQKPVVLEEFGKVGSLQMILGYYSLPARNKGKPHCIHGWLLG